VADRGGWRVDSDVPEEKARWVFAAPCEGLAELGHEIDRPHFLLKLCASPDVLMAMLPPRWRLQSQSWFMGTNAPPPAADVPTGYSVVCEGEAEVTHVRVLDSEGALAASGYAAQTADAFIYDRIRTEPEHRRRGLGQVVMATLGRQRNDPGLPQLLTATADGRALYTNIGWQVLAPYVTAGVA